MKLRMIEAMGGCCCACGYNRSASAMEFHHLDATKKDFGIGSATANPKSWDKVVAELRKCILLCANCHREFHEGIIELPANPKRFNEEYADRRLIAEAVKTSSCPVCTKPKRSNAKTCSLRCAGQAHHRIDWSKFDILTMVKSMTLTEIAARAGSSVATVHKRIKKLRAMPK